MGVRRVRGGWYANIQVFVKSRQKQTLVGESRKKLPFYFFAYFIILSFEDKYYIIFITISSPH